MVSLHHKRALSRRSWSLLHQWKLASDSGLLVKMNQRNTMIRYKRNNTDCLLPGYRLLHIGVQSYWRHISKKKTLKNYLTPLFFFFHFPLHLHSQKYRFLVPAKLFSIFTYQFEVVSILHSVPTLTSNS